MLGCCRDDPFKLCDATRKSLSPLGELTVAGELQLGQSLDARSIRAQQIDTERDEAAIEVGDRRERRVVDVDRGAQLEPVDGDVRLEKPPVGRITDRVEAGTPDVVSLCSDFL